MAQAADNSQQTKVVKLYAEEIVAADGSKSYRPLRVTEAGEICLAEAARISGLSVRQLQHLCDTGVFKTARKRGGAGDANSTSPWMISVQELHQYLEDRRSEAGR